MIGRFPKEIGMTHTLLMYILDKHPVLKTIPVMYDLDFAHPNPYLRYQLVQRLKLTRVLKKYSSKSKTPMSRGKR